MPNGLNTTSLEQKISELDVNKNNNQAKMPKKYVPPALRNQSKASSTTVSSMITPREVSSLREPSSLRESSSHSVPSTQPTHNTFQRSSPGPSRYESNRFPNHDSRPAFASYGNNPIRGAPSHGTFFGGQSSYAGSSHGNQLTYSSSRFHEQARPRNADVEARLFKKVQAAGINFEKYAEIPVEVSGQDIPAPITTFNECALHPIVQENVGFCGYSTATPVQKNAFPIVLKGRDLMACAQTGSGKTAAFLVPIISELLIKGPQTLLQDAAGDRGRATPFALVLAPTRELATQIYEEALKFAYRSWVRPVVVYGGAEPRDQMRQLSLGADILVATPGRLVDMIDRGKVSLASIKYFVLDEADRMLDMGFEPDIRRIVEQYGMPVKDTRNTLLFSATFPRQIQELARDFLRPSYVFLQVGKVGSSSENIAQRVELVTSSEKRSLLLDVLDAHMAKAAESNGVFSSRILVFAEKKRDVDILEEFLFQQGFKATSIHGDRTQVERERALHQFRQGITPILLATAVASRGLDIPNVHQVVIYDFPGDIDEYVHRIGRTGRAGNLGASIAFFTQENAGLAKDLLAILKEANQPIPKWMLSMTASQGTRGFSSRGGRHSSNSGTYRSSNTGGSLAMNRDIRELKTPSWGSSNTTRSSWSASPVPSTTPNNTRTSTGAARVNGPVASNWEDLDSTSSLRDSWY